MGAGALEFRIPVRPECYYKYICARFLLSRHGEWVKPVYAVSKPFKGSTAVTS